MRILSTVCRAYYGQSHAVEPMYLEFTLPLQRLGHHVDHFDHARLQEEIGPVETGDKFVRTVRYGGYDLVLYQTGGRDHMVREAIAHATRYAAIVAWNSDDDWQWESYSRHLAPYFTYMVTTYPHVYDANRARCGNLVLSQWAALDLYADAGRAKDLDFTFAGQVYRNRVRELRQLWWKADLQVFGPGNLRVWCPPLNNRKLRETVAKVCPAVSRAIDFRRINDIWNRSKISYTPMSASVDPSLLQIKSRAFEMGLSGTMMLCQNSPNLDRYYEPGKEYIPFDDLVDCISKSRYYLRHEAERERIAAAYLRRTRAEHLWEHRWQQLLRDIGMDGSMRAKVA